MATTQPPTRRKRRPLLTILLVLVVLALFTWIYLSAPVGNFVNRGLVAVEQTAEANLIVVTQVWNEAKPTAPAEVLTLKREIGARLRRSSPDDVLTRMLDAMRAGKPEQIYVELAPSLKLYYEEQDFSDQANTIDGYEIVSPPVEFELTGLDGNASEALVRIEKNGQQSLFIVQLIYEDNGWWLFGTTTQ